MFCKVLLNSLKIMAVFFLHFLSNSSSESHLCTYSCCFSTWFHAWIILCFLPSLPLHFCSNWMSVLEHILPLLFHCPCPVILTPQIPAVSGPFPTHILTPPCGVLSCFPPLFGRSGISYPFRNFRKVMRWLFWEWCFLSSLYCSLEDADFHFSCGRNHFQSFCLEPWLAASPEVRVLLALAREVWCCNCFFQPQSLLL